MTGVADGAGSDIVQKNNEGNTKMKLSLELSITLILNLYSTFLGVSPNCRWCHHVGISITALLQHHHHQYLHFEGAFGKQNG